MNYLWGGMLLAGILYGAVTGNLKVVTEAAIDSSKEAVSLAVAVAGITALWTGIMKIAEESGLVERPVLGFLFPEVPPEHPAYGQISLNMIANVLGLGWAATPAGLKAMEGLSELNGHSKRASNAMCNFLIINISSLQLIPINIVAYRGQYGSADPTAIVGPALLATMVSTAVGVIVCKVMDRGGGA